MSAKSRFADFDGDEFAADAQHRAQHAAAEFRRRCGALRDTGTVDKLTPQIETIAAELGLRGEPGDAREKAEELAAACLAARRGR